MSKLHAYSRAETSQHSNSTWNGRQNFQIDNWMNPLNVNEHLSSSYDNSIRQLIILAMLISFWKGRHNNFQISGFSRCIVIVRLLVLATLIYVYHKRKKIHGDQIFGISSGESLRFQKLGLMLIVFVLIQSPVH